MVTTRSTGRSEPLQRLSTPPKRQRKQKPRTAAQIVPHGTPFRTTSLSPEPVEQLPLPEFTPVIIPPPPARTYVDASTQTEEVVVLTKSEAAELRDRASASVSHKRSRDDESEDEPVAKRPQFSTPQSKSNNLWMFSNRIDRDQPRTAPSKTFRRQPLRRPMLGSLSKRNDYPNNSNSRISAWTQEVHENIAPIEREDRFKEQDARSQFSSSQETHLTETNTEENPTQVEQAEQTQQAEVSEEQAQLAALQTPRRGLFGSLRGIVHKGWDLAANLTPLGGRREPEPTNEPTSEPQQALITYPQLNGAEDSEDDEDSREENYHRESQDQPNRLAQSTPEAPRPYSAYDHLHYIPNDSESISIAMSGQLLPPSPPTPTSPTTRIKAQNPGLSDATIQSILRKRERKAALDEERYGPSPVKEKPKVAPLFGPDSHYARGTVDPRFVQKVTSFSAGIKRKIQSVDGKIPGPKSGGFGIDDEYLDVDTEIVSVDTPGTSDEPVEELAPPSKRSRIQETAPTTTTIPATPRSAMKKPGLTGTIGRKSVAFGQSVTRDIRGHYGPAGQYKGSTFADSSPDDSRTLSSINVADVISPATRLNTNANSGMRPASILENLGANIPNIDFTLRDPNHKDWRPSLGNPRPGAFRVPDIDEEDPDESMTDDPPETEDPPEQPSTPRMSHAELPAAPSTVGSVSFNESSIVNESTELALDKARSKAEKYKPKSSSRLSEVSRARSRSTSPDGADDDQRTSPSDSTAPAVKPIGAPPQPFVPRELDNENKGADGMTDYQREHQYDDWAASLNWDEPQTYEDAGTGSAFIHNLIRKNWTKEDDARSEVFWAREFDEVDLAMEAAKAQGQVLTLITGMEEMEGY